MAAIQGDVVSLFATDVAAAAGAVPPGLFASDGGRALAVLLASNGWGASMALDSRTATAAATLTARLATLPAAETGTDTWREMLFMVNALRSDHSQNGSDPACLAAGAANCSAYLAGALDAVADSLGVRGPGDGAGTAAPWGRGGVHAATFTHAVLGHSLLACAANVPVDHGGDDSTVNVGTMVYGGDGRFAQSAGPSYRQIADLSPGGDGTSLFVHGPGQSGNLVERGAQWYAALAGAWATQQYTSMAAAPGTFESAPGTLVQALSPA